MLWRTMLRETAVGLLANAFTTGGVSITSAKDTPVPAAATPSVIVYVDDKLAFDYGSEPQGKRTATITIEIDAIADEAPAAKVLLDSLCEIAENALFGGQGFDVACVCTANSFNVKPKSVGGIAAGMPVRLGPFKAGAPLVAVQSVNQDGSLTLTQAVAASGTFLFNVGDFVHLFESMTESQTFTDYEGRRNKSHIAHATLEIVGHIHERFQPTPTQALTGLNLYVDSVNVFDPQGNYEGLEPFAVAPPPRAEGPDGRPEISGPADLPQN